MVRSKMMTVNEDLIAGIVEKIFIELSKENRPDQPSANGLYNTIDEAVENAVKAQKQLIAMSLEDRDKIIGSIRQVILAHNEEISALAIQETKYGRYEDKIKENILCATKTPGTEDIHPEATTGDNGLMLLEHAPVGVIGALTPITNPTGTFICNSIGMIAAGNAVVFNPHPSAKKTSARTIELIHKAIVDAGGPHGLVSSIIAPDLNSAKQLIKHPRINMLVATGGKPVVNVVLSSGKKAIGAGSGNPPALVDETAHIRKAAESIINGASINNNIFCTCEKEVIAVEEIAETLIKFMQETGRAYLLSPDEAEKLTALVVKPDGKINIDYIGKDVQLILKKIGIELDEKYRIAIFNAPKDHPLVWLEQMMPILPIVRVKDVQEAIRFGVEVEQGNRHTAIMHSTNVDNLTAFARAIQTTIFVKNGPAYAGIGLGGEGHTSFTIAGPTGEGLTSARSFTRQRRCTLVEGFRII